MKPFWFAFNTADWLSSKSVRMMSNAERGAYIGLLATAWGEDRPGTLPAAEDTVRRLAEMSPAEWAISGPVLLDMFPLSECKTYRYNQRLLDEAEASDAIRQKKAEAGRKSAAKRAALLTEGQQNGNTCSTPVENPATDDGQNANQLQLQLQLQAKADKKLASSAGLDKASPTESPDEPQRPTARALRCYRYDNAPVFIATAFHDYLNAQGYGHVDWGMYLVRITEHIKNTLADPQQRKIKPEATNDDWKRFILAWLDRDKAQKKLLLPDAAPLVGYPGPNTNLQLGPRTSTTATSNYSPAAIAAANVVKY